MARKSTKTNTTDPVINDLGESTEAHPELINNHVVNVDAELLDDSPETVKTAAQVIVEGLKSINAFTHFQARAKSNTVMWRRKSKVIQVDPVRYVRNEDKAKLTVARKYGNDAIILNEYLK